jgi:multiple sugar transport system permease protein
VTTRAVRPGRRLNPFRRRGALDLPPAAKFGVFVLLSTWALIVLFPIYWLVITSFKTPVDVDKGPFYLPFVDFHPTLDAWRYILVELGNDTLRPYVNTVVVGLTSSLIALVLGAAAAYALVRFTYRPRLGVIGLFLGSVAFAVVAVALGAPPVLAIVSAVAVFFVLFQAIGRRFRRAVGNSDIAFWLISQRILPPIAIVVPLYVLFQQVGLLDSLPALIITYVAANLPIVVWLMRDYFATLPKELEESAAVDGASIYRIVRSIVLPIAVPGLVATFLIVLIFAWNEFLIALVLTSAKAQTMPLQVAAQNATRGPQWWAMSVLILIMITPVVAMAVALERYISRGILIGAVKG